MNVHKNISIAVVLLSLLSTISFSDSLRIPFTIHFQKSLSVIRSLSLASFLLSLLEYMMAFFVIVNCTFVYLANII